MGVIEVRKDGVTIERFDTGKFTADLAAAFLYLHERGVSITEGACNGWQIVGIGQDGTESCGLCGGPLAERQEESMCTRPRSNGGA